MFLRNNLSTTKASKHQYMLQIEITGNEFDSFYISTKELLWIRLRPVGQKFKFIYKFSRDFKYL